jgi:uncharacterized protein with GYD domain
MPAYVVLFTWTDQGIRNYRDTVERASGFRGMVEQAGGRVREQLWTMGAYDIVAIVEAPDDATATGVMLQVSSLGNVRTTTLRAYDADQMTDLIGRTS